MGRNAADILVAIRSGLVTQSSDGVSSQEARCGANGGDSGPKTKVSIFLLVLVSFLGQRFKEMK
jgi:hypothetical protein